MGLETLVGRLRETGSEEANAVLGEARTERERLLAEARSEGQKLRALREAEAREQAERRRVQDLARAELDAKKLVLAAREEVLNIVRDRVRARLSQTSDPEALRKLLSKNEADWKTGRVYANKRDAPVVSKVVGRNFAGEIDCLGGVVIESADGTTRVDLTYDSILSDLWDDVIKEVAQTLWPPK